MEAERPVAEGVAGVTGAAIQVSVQPQSERTPERQTTAFIKIMFPSMHLSVAFTPAAIID